MLIRPARKVEPAVRTTARVHVGDCLTKLRRIADDTFDCVVTSPPYYFVRDYQCEGQIGLEATPDEYIAKLAAVFGEVLRVLKPTGTLWLNIDDNYCTRRAIRDDGKRSVLTGKALRSWKECSAAGRVLSSHTFKKMGLPYREKSLLRVPETLVDALGRQGWLIRADIIWIKSQIVPERATDRPARSYEHVYLLTKRATGYMWNAEALVERGVDGTGRPGRDVWEIPACTIGDHGAAMPEELARRCILAGSPIGGRVLDPFGGSGTTGVVARQLGRSADLIELNPAFAESARARLRAVRTR